MLFFILLCKQSLQSQLAGQKTMARRASLSKRRRSTVSRSQAQEKINVAQKLYDLGHEELGMMAHEAGHFGIATLNGNKGVGYAQCRTKAERRVTVTWENKGGDHCTPCPAN